jgi:CxC2 like cysteine cluster associated with KDZ transposases
MILYSVNHQTQNDYLQEWKHKHRQTHLAKLVELEAPPANKLCINCQQCPGLYRCLDCHLGQRLLCKKCCLRVHQHNPFHKIQYWTGQFFDRADLGELGLIIHLGHDGNPCPQPTTSPSWEDVEDDNMQIDKDDDIMVEENLDDFSQSRTTTMVFVDSSGIYRRHVYWCQCSATATHETQLFNMRFFPATSSRPTTAFTFTVLHQFYIEAMECKVSAFNFYSKLRRLTDNNFPHLIPVHLSFVCKLS